jgi:hypothetical protein
MHRLLIRHQPQVAGLYFEVQRVDSKGARSAPQVALTDPLAVVLGGSDLTLGHELAWYLEHYLDLPTGPNQARAERVQQALRQWGQQSFDTLFNHGQAHGFYLQATEAGHTELHLVVVSDDARVLSWPWEALHDPQVGDLAQHCRIERQLDTVREPPALPPGLPQDRVNILLVTARPYQNDVAYRSITRPLVELIQQERLPAEVTLLRPPTFEQLRSELQAHPGRYHIVHFDGHGGFGPVSGGSADRLKGPLGQLVFEDAEGGEDPITSAQLSALLREHRIPIAVLNACQSAMLSDQADDAFASVATALLRGGVRSVVAMGYSLYVSGARQFLPAFYRQLFRTGNVAEATRAGRQAMLAKPQRMGEVELQDWLVPVLYQQDPLSLSFVQQARSASTPATDQQAVPEAARVDAGHAPHGVIGRDSAMLALERAARRAPPAVLLHGLGGVGKTTLARGYIEWLAHTRGLPQRVIWQDMTDVRAFDYLRNRLMEELFGTNAMALPDAQKWPALMQTLRENAVLIVWDNFESASGMADVTDGNTAPKEIDLAMPPEQRQELLQWLVQLRGGKSRVLITSRSNEQWLGTTACFRLALGGLQGEERQELARAILADQGLKLDPRDAATAALVESLQGHPLMMRAILPQLGAKNAAQVQTELDSFVPQAESADPVQQRLYATLRYVEQGLPEGLRGLLLPIGLHEGYVDAGHLAAMARQAGQPYEITEVRQALERLEAAGLVQGQGNNVYEMHPALERYARARGRRELEGHNKLRQAWEKAFCHLMAGLAGHYAPMELHEQRPVFGLFGSSFERARAIAQERGALKELGALMQAQAAYALNQRNLPLAAQRFQAYAEICEQQGREDGAAAPYHQLGRVAEERRDFGAAEDWYRKSLAITERLCNEHGAALTYHQLGSVAKKRRDFNAAEDWYRKSLAIEERQGNEHGAAITYHQLGTVALERRNFDAAEDWYRKSLAVKERLGDEHSAASTYGQLGNTALDRRDLDAAEDWYLRTLAIFERLGDERGAASTYNQLGSVAQERRDFDAAEDWYRKSLAINERLGNEHGAAITYHQLGSVALERRDFDIAEDWYRRSLAINELVGDKHGAAGTYHQLGYVAEGRRDLDAAHALYHQALQTFMRIGDAHYAALAKRSLDRLPSASASRWKRLRRWVNGLWRAALRR